jgi:hypothetical protein
MTIADFDHLPLEQKQELLRKCCGSASWIDKMIAASPVKNLAALVKLQKKNGTNARKRIGWKLLSSIRRLVILTL